ncbi:MAG: 4-alpha-glucanotransferase [Spirochaetaceae bacterium]|jgi:4-alpha-glucanotransferase|nr:4-alpha-glucanotransferase [Spirochaetaceae bacterium]
MAQIQRDRSFEKRLIGVVVPVGALRSDKSIGVGEFPDLVEFADLCVSMGVGLIQLLPVNDTGYQCPPYFALTAFALHPLYLRIGDLPELKGPGSGEFIRRLEAMRKEFEQEVRYPFERIIRAKIDILRRIYAANRETIGKKAGDEGPLGRWIQENPWVKEFAVYRRLKEANGEKSWKEWSSHRKISLPASPDRLPPEIETLWNDETLRQEHIFWVWVQEALDSQFREAAAAVTRAGILLEGDLPILMNEDCCDAWAHPQYFHDDLSAGAPPDMYSPDGQNWGFPIYDWDALAKEDYAWWRRRLQVAEKYYRAYRIDHVLGFFRIWSTSRRETSSALGRFVPYVPVKYQDLKALGYDKGRIHWMSRSHIPTGEVWDFLRANWGGPFREEDIAAEAERLFSMALDRIGKEELWLFKDSIAGEKDIEVLDLHPASRACLIHAWHNRLLLEYEKGLFSPVWYYRFSRAYASLSDGERQALEELLDNRKRASERIWEAQGKRLLSVLVASSSMLPCAEDLGVVPDCVPRVLTKLKIMGLRVVRWFRDWDREGQPYIPFEEYPELSVCTPAVHDSSTLREWWEQEADQEMFCSFIGVPSLPKVYNPGTAKLVLSKTAAAVSRFRVFQIQDLLHISPKWYAGDPASERINVPGTYNEFNWTYRLPGTIAEIGKDSVFIQGVRDLSAVQPVTKKKKK